MPSKKVLVESDESLHQILSEVTENFGKKYLEKKQRVQERRKAVEVKQKISQSRHEKRKLEKQKKLEEIKLDLKKKKKDKKRRRKEKTKDSSLVNVKPSKKRVKFAPGV